MDDKDQPQERVLIEDYHGPASTLPPSAPTNAQITAETKQEPGTVSQPDRAYSTIDAMAQGGMLCGVGSSASLAVMVFGFLILDHHIPWHYISFGNWVLALPLALVMISFILSTTALLRYRLAGNPGLALFRSRVGLGLCGLMVVVALLAYVFG